MKSRFEYHAQPSLEEQRWRKSGQIRALIFLHGFIGKELAKEKEELRALEAAINS